MLNKLNRLNKLFIPETSNCSNKWCNNKGSIPATGDLPITRGCGSFNTMTAERLAYGGVTGRGVTPCPFGYLQTIPEHSDIVEYTPYDKMNQGSILFDPKLPGYLPPQGNVRSFKRIGYEWRNN